MQRKQNSDQSSLHRMFEQKKAAIDDKQQMSSIGLASADGSMSMRFQDTQVNFRGLLGSLDIYHNFLADGNIFIHGNSIHLHLRDSYIANPENASDQNSGWFGSLFGNKAQELESAKQNANLELHSFTETSLSYSNVELHFDDPVKECWSEHTDIGIVSGRNGLYIEANAPELTYIKKHNEDEEKLSELDDSQSNRFSM